MHEHRKEAHGKYEPELWPVSNGNVQWTLNSKE